PWAAAVTAVAMDAASPMTSRQTLPNDVRNWPIVFISEPDATQLKLTGMGSTSSCLATALMARGFVTSLLSLNRVVIVVSENGLFDAKTCPAGKVGGAWAASAGLSRHGVSGHPPPPS